MSGVAAGHVHCCRSHCRRVRSTWSSSALAVHHLDADEKADLFSASRRCSPPVAGSCSADVVVPRARPTRSPSSTDGYDKPSTVADQLRWLREAGFERVGRMESESDLAVLVAEVPSASRQRALVGCETR